VCVLDAVEFCVIVKYIFGPKARKATPIKKAMADMKMV
jgi:hypothetical protein